MNLQTSQYAWRDPPFESSAVVLDVQAGQPASAGGQWHEPTSSTAAVAQEPPVVDTSY